METSICIQIEIEYQSNELNDLCEFSHILHSQYIMITLQQFTYLTESQLRKLENENPANDNFADILLREANAINSKVDAQSVCSAMEIEDQKKVSVVDRLTAIIRLFDKIDGMVPIDSKRERRDYIIKMKRIFYEKWIMKCMYRICSRFSVDVHVLLFL